MKIVDFINKSNENPSQNCTPSNNNNNNIKI